MLLIPKEFYQAMLEMLISLLKFGKNLNAAQMKAKLTTTYHQMNLIWNYLHKEQCC